MEQNGGNTSIKFIFKQENNDISKKSKRKMRSQAMECVTGMLLQKHFFGGKESSFLRAGIFAKKYVARVLHHHHNKWWIGR